MHITSFLRSYWTNVWRFASAPLWPAVLTICLYLQFLMFGILGLVLMVSVFLFTGCLDAVEPAGSGSSDARQKIFLGSAYAMMALLLIVFLLASAGPVPLFPAWVGDLIRMTLTSVIVALLVWTGPEVARWMRE